ncbi:hypothetical protein [Lacrimispora xylanisolvens]|uniref:hypothetical protein n=1 Tax=Lacrimispora xylanisolvens TaxID=384636 RepID=UPI002402A25D|nr:hypothetical protein [Paenibacillaceae bacterium]
MEEKNLNKALTPVKLWAIIVGAVVSGMYFGWNYLFEKTNFTGALIATFIVTLFYVSFVFCYSELATAIPSAAGPTAYAEKSFGKFAGFPGGFPGLSFVPGCHCLCCSYSLLPGKRQGFCKWICIHRK